MEYKDAISMFFERSQAMQTFWNFYITIILALIAFFASTPTNSKLPLLRRFIIFGFIAFAIVNLRALIEVSEQRNQIAFLCKALAEKDQIPANFIVSSIQTPEIWKIYLFHISADLMTIAAIWMLSTNKVGQAPIASP